MNGQWTMDNGQWTMKNGPLGPKGRLRREAEQEWIMDNLNLKTLSLGPKGRLRRETEQEPYNLIARPEGTLA